MSICTQEPLQALIAPHFSSRRVLAPMKEHLLPGVSCRAPQSVWKDAREAAATRSTDARRASLLGRLASDLVPDCRAVCAVAFRRSCAAG